MNFLKSPSQPSSGRMLSNEEISVLESINKHSYKDLTGFSNLGAINSLVPVELQDKKNPPHKELVKFNLMKIEYQIGVLKRYLEGLGDPFSRDDDFVKDSEIEDLENGTVVPNNVSEAERIKRLIRYYRNICKKGITVKEIEVTWLGCYCPVEKKVILYTGSIGTDINTLVSTYVHEMFHAFFDTDDAIPQIEEPIVECAMLQFLENFDKKNKTDFFHPALKSVELKRFSPSICHYGFGAHLYSTPEKWIRLYKKYNYRKFEDYIETPFYIDGVSGAYPFGSERDYSLILKRIITKSFLNTIEENNRHWDIHLNDEGISDDQLKPIDDLNTTSKKSLVTANIYLDEHATPDVLASVITKFLQYNLWSLGAVNIILSPKNKFFKLVGDLLLSADESTFICPIRKIRKLNVPSSVTNWTIPNLFALNTDLEEIVSCGNIGNSVAVSFQKCSSLAKVVLPNGMTSICKSAFFQCDNLSEVYLPQSLTSIGDRAFSCTNLKSIYIPDSVAVIGEQAFEDCINLKSISIPDSVAVIGEQAFENCINLESVKLPKALTKIPDSLFEFCTALKEVDIHDSVTSIGANAFYDCESLVSITIPNSVKFILGKAFECTNLEKITMPAKLELYGSDHVTDGGLCIKYFPFEHLSQKIDISLTDDSGSVIKKLDSLNDLNAYFK